MSRDDGQNAHEGKLKIKDVDMGNMRKLAKEHADHSVPDAVAAEEEEEYTTRYLVGIEALGHLTAVEIEPELAEKTIGDVLNHLFKMDWANEDDKATIERARVEYGSVYGHIVKMSANDYKDPKKWEAFNDATRDDKISDYFVEYFDKGDRIKYAGMRFD